MGSATRAVSDRQSRLLASCRDGPLESLLSPGFTWNRCPPMNSRLMTGCSSSTGLRNAISRPISSGMKPSGWPPRAASWAACRHAWPRCRSTRPTPCWRPPRPPSPRPGRSSACRPCSAPCSSTGDGAAPRTSSPSRTGSGAGRRPPSWSTSAPRPSATRRCARVFRPACWITLASPTPTGGALP